LRGKQKVPIDPKTTALVLIEYQNDFTTEGGALHAGVKPVMESTNMLANTVHAAARARAAGVTVMFVPISFAEGFREITPEPYGILKGVVDANAFVRGSWGAEIVDLLSPESQDIIIEGKRGLDTFASTNLDFILRSRGIKTLVVAGFLTNCCVESTARTGYEKGFSVVALSDCAATLSQEEQRFTFEKNLPMFARILTHTEFLSELAL
jgi:ureidoacrylate peracid hydrolase